jgi:hypothetical protein
MRGYNEFKGITYLMEFDAVTQSFVQKPVNVPTHVKKPLPEVDGKLAQADVKMW